MSDGEYLGLLCPKQLAKAAAEGRRLIESSQRLRRLNEEARWQANVIAARSHALRRAAQRINEACLEAAEAIVLRDAERLALLHEAATELMANLQRAHSTAPRVDRSTLAEAEGPPPSEDGTGRTQPVRTRRL